MAMQQTQEFYSKLGALRATNSRETLLCKEPYKAGLNGQLSGYSSGFKPVQTLTKIAPREGCMDQVCNRFSQIEPRG